MSAVSLMPLSTAWIASTELAAIPVTVHAGVFVLVNATYIQTRSHLCTEISDRGVALICLCLIVYLRPDTPGVKM